MSSKISLALVFGGKSTEHIGSIESALHLLSYVDTNKYDVHIVYIDKDGSFLTPSELQAEIPNMLNNPNAYTFPEKYTPKEDFEEQLIDMTLFPQEASKEKQLFFENVQEKKYDIVFPVLHGKNGEDGSIQGFLELMDMPYVGSGIAGACNTLDKEITKRLCMGHDIPVVPFMTIRNHQWSEQKDSLLEEIENTLQYPVYIKPVSLGSSIGISKAQTPDELITGIEKALTLDNKVLIEMGVEATEYAISLIGNDKPQISNIAEFCSCNEFFDYDAKYGPNSINSIIPAPLSEDFTASLKNHALKIYQALDIRGLARIDLFVTDKKEVYLNEVNAIPGLELIGTFYKQWKSTKLSKEQMFDKLIEAGLEEAELKRRISVENLELAI